jgi:hypothetical protein
MNPGFVGILCLACCVLDRLVAAVLSGSVKASKLGLEYFHRTWDAEGFFRRRELDSGGFVPWDDMEIWIDRAAPPPLRRIVQGASVPGYWTA